MRDMHGRWLLGTVVWFDASSGEGQVEVGNRLYYCHYTAVEGVDKSNFHWPLDQDRKTLAALPGKACKVQIYQGGMVCIDKLELL